MKKKRIVIIILIVLVFVFVIISLLIPNNLFFNIRMLGVNKDIIIEQCKENPGAGGYASNLDYYYIDINKNKIYHVKDYYVFGVTTRPGESGSHYTLVRLKKNIR